MKNNCERDEFTPSLSAREQIICEKQCDVVNGDKGSLGLDPKEEQISYFNSSSELPKEVEDKPPPAGCELGNLKEKNMMQREGHSSECWTLLQHDEAEIPRNEMLSDFYTDHLSFQHSEIPSTSHHGSDFAENAKADLYAENEFWVCGSISQEKWSYM